MNIKDEKLREEIMRLAGNFLSLESNRTSLITVTGATLSRDLTKATIFISVLPDDKSMVAIDFVKRKRGDFREYVKTKGKLSRLPFFDFEINKQDLPSLSQLHTLN